MSQEDDNGSNTWTYQGNNLNILTINGKSISYYRDENPPVDSVYNWTNLTNLWDNLSAVRSSQAINTLRVEDTLRLTDASNNTLNITALSNPATGISVTNNNNNSLFYPTFVDSSGNNKTMFIDTTPLPLTFNPSTCQLTCEQINADIQSLNNNAATTTHYVGMYDSASTGYGRPQKNTKFTFNPSTATAVISDGTNTTTIAPSTVTSNSFSGTATNASAVSVTDSNTNATFYPTFVDGSGNTKTVFADITTSPLTYNPSTGTLSTSNLTISGTGAGQRILADFTSANQNRTNFQTTTANSTTYLTPIPSGTGNTAGMDAYNSSSVNNCPRLRVEINNTQSLINSTFTGTSSALPISIQTAGVERIGVSAAGDTTITGTTTNNGNLTISGTARRIQADFNNGAQSNRLAFQTSTANQFTSVNAIPNGTNTSASWEVFNSSSMNNCGRANFGITTTAATLRSESIGSGTTVPLVLAVNAGPAVTIDTSNVALFANVPTCTTSATTTNQLVNFNNFSQSSYTPTLISSGGGVPTYSRQAGRFIRINNFCMFDGEIQTTAVNTLAAGNLSVLLPQTNDSSSRAAITIGLLNGISSSYHNCASFVGLSDDKAVLQFRPQSTDDNFTDITVADVDFTNFRIIYSGSYTCA